MRNTKVMVTFVVIILIVGIIVFYNFQLKIIDNNPEPIDDEPELHINPDDENGETENPKDEQVDNNSNNNEMTNSKPIIIDDINSKIVLTKRSTFIKTSAGNSYVTLEVPETTSVQLSYIVDDCNIDSGYAFIILSKEAKSTYGAEFWDSMYFWKQNEIQCDLFYHPSFDNEMRPGTYDLFILSDFGRWGIIIETDLDGGEYEYEILSNNKIIFEAVEYAQEHNDRSQFVKEIRFKDTYFNIDSNGMLFRFEYTKADMEGQGIESIEIEHELYDPNGESVGGGGSGMKSFYNNNEYIHTGFGWDRVYAEKGKWTGSGNCTIETLGKPNTDSYDIHVFEFVIYF